METQVVRIVEVGPRDGLQNEADLVPTEVKIRFVEALAAAGATDVETTSFVNPKAVPQLADADAVMRGVRRARGVRYSVLVPNERGLDRALATGADAISLFASATESFSQANLRASIDETFERFVPVAAKVRAHGHRLRGYVSVSFACPFGGPVPPAQSVEVAKRLFDLGCDEVAFADTIGTARPTEVTALLELALQAFPVDRLALHFHDTHGAALANVGAGLDAGVRTLDGAAGGLGGCPFAPGAPGNLATEDLVEYLHRAGYTTGVDSNAIRMAVRDLRAASGGDAPPSPP